MEREYWLRQEPGKPLFPELEWSRPENRLQAGKLLVAGGNAHGFVAPAEAYTVAAKAGAGSVRVLLPDAVQKIVGATAENTEFAPSTPGSGSFSQKALEPLLSMALWADAVLVAGDLGRNSETAIVLEKFLAKHNGAVTLTKDAVDYATTTPDAVMHRPDTLLVLSLSQLQRLAVAAHWPSPVQFSMHLLQLVEWLHHFTGGAQRPHIIVKHLDQLYAAAQGKVSTTRLAHDIPTWRVPTAAKAAVWWMQNPSRPFEALTTALIEKA